MAQATKRDAKKKGYFTGTEKKAFDAGCYFALAQVIQNNGRVEDAMSAMGMSMDEAKKLNVEKYDLKFLAPVLEAANG